LRRKSFLWACAALSLLVAGWAATGATPPTEDTVVYHFSEGLEQASNGLRNIRNHLEVNPNAKIVVVAHAKGVDFLMKGVKDKNGNKYEDLVEQLQMRGVQFDVCQITLRDRKLSKDQFIEYATFVPSGVAEISKLEHQGYAYLKP
jgi:intracellular sulfur oxidation DsrE/DsrF family protein